MKRSGMAVRLTSISNLTGITARRPVSKLRERRPDLVQRFNGSTIPNALVAGKSHGLDLPSLGILHLSRDGDDLIIEPARLLRRLGPPERLRRVRVLHLARDVEVGAHVLRRLAHGLHTVRRLLVLQHLLVERPRQPVAACRHQLRANRDAHVDRAQLDLVRDVLHRLQTRRAEPVDRRRAGCVGDPRGESGSAHEVGGFAVVDLTPVNFKTSWITNETSGKRTLPRQTSSMSAGSSFDFCTTSFNRA